MENQENEIKDFLETFFQATQVSAIYFDREMQVISRNPRRYVVEDFLNACDLESFLKMLFESKVDIHKNFYTYYLDQNLICNISPVYHMGICCGAAVSEPVLLSLPSKSDFESNEGGRKGPELYDAYRAIMQRCPVVEYERVKPMGEVLGTLARTVFAESRGHQILFKGDSSIYRFLQSGQISKRGDPTIITKRPHGGYPMYQKVKSAISRGDTDGLMQALRSFDAGTIHLDHKTSKDVVRSIKNSFIEGLAMCCFIAVEAGAPYGKARDLSEELVQELEGKTSIAEMYKLMEAGLLAFARLVAVTHIAGRSRPVRQAIEYIEAHYADKLTLKVLAQQVNLSEFYLSALVKKETGSNITDIINRVRVEESKSILRKSSVSINELSSMVGFSYSNHFSRVFKRYTGMTPSEYVKMSVGSADDDDVSRDMMNMLLDQLRHFMLMFPGIFHAVRIVDPGAALAWKVQQENQKMVDTCYAFWGRSASCNHCVSRMAWEQDKPFVKREQGKGDPFLVFATPVTVGGKKYVIELLKNVGENYFDCAKDRLIAEKGEYSLL